MYKCNPKIILDITTTFECGDFIDKTFSVEKIVEFSDSTF